ncbi:peroxiredoxin family protein [Methylomonas rapida]|jgi:Peroxiredoxin|uniref:TlpA disulfide reductase family protein n=1 Tax=Methylomonas rapida TaxID=2963939 RepID=A0ABY7GPD6_9GAMM|nr:TlpA disulfide reductase family protein [Methylomonas rapida]WAR46335.1 TlpA disulfide reductase family protein [Methylomonas rapida]
MNIKQATGIFLFIGLLAAAVWYWQTQTVRVAPAVSFTTIKGENLSLPTLKGKPVIVTFWATDCPGCIEEIPQLVSLYQQYSQQGLNIIAVAMHYDPPNHVREMAESKKLPYAIALDPSGELAQAFGNVQLTPTTFLIDKAGNIIMEKVGVFNLADMKRRLESLS